MLKEAFSQTLTTKLQTRKDARGPRYMVKAGDLLSVRDGAIFNT